MKKENLKEADKAKEPKTPKIIYHFGFYLSLTFEDGSKDCVQFIYDDATIFHSGKEISYLIEKTAEKLVEQKEKNLKKKIVSWSFITKNDYFSILFHADDGKTTTSPSDVIENNLLLKEPIIPMKEEESVKEKRPSKAKITKKSEVSQKNSIDQMVENEQIKEAPVKEAKEVKETKKMRKVEILDTQKKAPIRRKKKSVANTPISNKGQNITEKNASVSADSKTIIELPKDSNDANKNAEKTVQKDTKKQINESKKENKENSKAGNSDGSVKKSKSLTSSTKCLSKKTESTIDKAMRELSEFKEIRKPIESIIPYDDSLLKSADDIVHPKNSKKSVRTKEAIIPIKFEHSSPILSPMGGTRL